MKVTAPTVFHRKIYAPDPEDNLYLKFGEISNEIKSLDELILLDTKKACMLRLVCKWYVVVCQGEETELVCTFGALSNRSIDKNTLDGYGSNFYKTSDAEITPLAAILKRKNTIENHVEYAKGRLKDRSDEFTGDIKNNSARRHVEERKDVLKET